MLSLEEPASLCAEFLSCADMSCQLRGEADVCGGGDSRRDERHACRVYKFICSATVLHGTTLEHVCMLCVSDMYASESDCLSCYTPPYEHPQRPTDEHLQTAAVPDKHRAEDRALQLKTCDFVHLADLELFHFACRWLGLTC